MTSIKVNTFLTRYLTDNVMDYAKEKRDEAKLKSTYKWQWDIVWDTAVKRQIPNDN